jgi:hypothetical protein
LCETPPGNRFGTGAKSAATDSPEIDNFLGTVLMYIAVVAEISQWIL